MANHVHYCLGWCAGSPRLHGSPWGRPWVAVGTPGTKCGHRSPHPTTRSPNCQQILVNLGLSLGPFESWWPSPRAMLGFAGGTLGHQVWSWVTTVNNKITKQSTSIGQLVFESWILIFVDILSFQTVLNHKEERTVEKDFSPQQSVYYSPNKHLGPRLKNTARKV